MSSRRRVEQLRRERVGTTHTLGFARKSSACPRSRGESRAMGFHQGYADPHMDTRGTSRHPRPENNSQSKRVEMGSELTDETSETGAVRGRPSASPRWRFRPARDRRANRPRGTRRRRRDLPAAGRLPPREDDAGPRADDVALGRRRDARQPGRPELTYVARIGCAPSGSARARSPIDASRSCPRTRSRSTCTATRRGSYFECHDIGDYDLPTRFIASDTFLAGTVRRIEGNWVFWYMTAGRPTRSPSTTSTFP